MKNMQGIVANEAATAICTIEKHVTAKDIADKLGVSRPYVSRCLSDSKPVTELNSEKVALVRKVAKEMGYDPKTAKENRKFYYNGCFHTRVEEQERMKQLRAEGYSNAEIAAKIGRVVITVRRAIGAQPEDMSRMNRVQGQKNRAAKNEQRRVYVATHTVNTFNEVVDQMGEVNRQIVSLTAQQKKLEKQVQEMVPAVKAAAKLSKVQPHELPIANIAAPDPAVPVQ